MSNCINAIVVGATGYAGAELVSILGMHPNFKLAAATSTSEAGSYLSQVYPTLVGSSRDILLTELRQCDLSRVDVAFLAVPHTTSMALVPMLLQNDVRVIDLSADFRLTCPDTYKYWYKTEHTAPQLLNQARYVLPEVTGDDELTDAELIACPGCYPTASILASAPLLSLDLARRDTAIIIDAKSGVSGAGRSASAVTHYCNVDQSVTAYKVASHQHSPEIAQELSLIASRDVSVIFTPHLIPIKRGLLATVYITCSDTNLASISDIYNNYYAKQPFVTVLAQGQQPKTSSVVMTNNAQIGIAYDTDSSTAIISCAIDNLGKGAASQAVQIANIAYGLKQTEGLVSITGVIK